MTIREICKKYSLSQTALARRFGIPLRTVQNWCEGINYPPEYVVDMIVKILDMEAKLNRTYSAAPSNSDNIFDEHAVRKTLTIPSWLNDAAEARAVNFSNVLQDALCEKLSL